MQTAITAANRSRCHWWPDAARQKAAHGVTWIVCLTCSMFGGCSNAQERAIFNLSTWRQPPVPWAALCLLFIGCRVVALAFCGTGTASAAIIVPGRGCQLSRWPEGIVAKNALLHWHDKKLGDACCGRQQ